MNTDGLTKTSLSSNFTTEFLSQGVLMLLGRLHGAGTVLYCSVV